MQDAHRVFLFIYTVNFHHSVKNLIKTLKNIWGIEELRSKILFTLLLIFIYRIGTHIVLPGINPTKLDLGINATGILGLIDTFAGGAFLSGFNFGIGYYALHFCLYLYAIDDCFSSSISKNAKGRRKWTKKNQSMDSISYCSRGSCTSIAYVAYLAAT